MNPKKTAAGKEIQGLSGYQKVINSKILIWDEYCEQMMVIEV